MITKSEVLTLHGSAYTKRLCKHFSHKIPASVDGNVGVIHFPFGVCTIESDEYRMLVRVAVENATDAERAERVVADHLIRMANKDEPVVSWDRESD